MRYFIQGLLMCVLTGAPHLIAVPISDLPGEDISNSEVEKSLAKVKVSSGIGKKSSNWLSPSVSDQLSRDRTLIPFGKGALFVPTYSEPRREPEVAILNSNGKLIKTAPTGKRIILDSGTYNVRFGSGTMSQQVSVNTVIEEGHTTVVPPDWGGLLVETLTGDGAHIDGQYEVVRMEKWISYGKGRGLKLERLQDIKIWILPPGLYRINKSGEGFTSLRNFITVQINPGELSQVELIFDKAISGDIIAGGLKSLEARQKVGSYWTYGLRVAGNVNLNRKTEDDDVRTEAMKVSSDIRLRGLFDNARYLGNTEILLQDNFSKEGGIPFSVTTDIAELRTTWIRRLNEWVGPYVRGTVKTNIFQRKADKDTVTLIEIIDSSGTPVRRLRKDVSGDFIVAPSFDPIVLGEGVGVNVQFVSKYYLEASAQVGFAGRQTLTKAHYLSNNNSEYAKQVSTFEIGSEGILNSTLRLGSQMALDLRVEMFAPNANLSRVRLDDLTADFRLFLTRNLEVGYLFQVNESSKKAKNRFPSTHNISLRLSFNY